MTSRSKATLADWVEVIRQLENKHWANDTACGRLCVADARIQALLEDFLAHPDDFPCQVMSGDPDSIAIGAVLELGFGLPRLGIGYVFIRLDDFLLHEEARCGRMKRWYIDELDWLYGEPQPDFGGAYQAMTEFVGMLEQSAVVVDKADARLVFLPEGRLDIPVMYGRDSLSGFNIEALNEIRQLLARHDKHEKQCREIFATAVCDMVKDADESERFRLLVEKLPELAQRCVDGYHLFASSFSFEKIRDQAEATRVEYTTRIHKALSDIQGQLLGIPVSTIIVATQLKAADTPGPLMWGNIAVIVGAFVFSILLFLAMRNQWHTLDVIGLEVDRQRKSTAKESPEIAERLEDVFSSLDRRICHQRWIMGVIGCFCVLGFGLAFVMFWTMTAPALSIFL